MSRPELSVQLSEPALDLPLHSLLVMQLPLVVPLLAVQFANLLPQGPLGGGGFPRFRPGLEGGQRPDGREGEKDGDPPTQDHPPDTRPQHGPHLQIGVTTDQSSMSSTTSLCRAPILTSSP